MGHVVGKKIGIRSLTRRALELPRGLTLSGISLLCALVAEGITVKAIEESFTNDSLLLRGIIPSSLFHFEGEISINVTRERTRSMADVTIVYPGQIFAWGSGGRLFTKLCHHSKRALERLQSCLSLKNL